VEPCGHYFTAVLHALANVLLGDDGRVGAELCVATDVIAVPVRIENETHRLVADALECSLDLRRQRRKFVVHNDDAVVAD